MKLARAAYHALKEVFEGEVMHMRKIVLIWFALSMAICFSGCGHWREVVPLDYREGAFEVVVRGEMCRTMNDGYDQTTRPLVDGIGVSGADEVISFAAHLKVGEVLNSDGYRNATLTYTSPQSLSGVEVSCLALQASDGVWHTSYTLSLTSETGKRVVFDDMDEKQVSGLLRPLYMILPVGDVSSITPLAGEGVEITYISSHGGSVSLTFDKEQNTLPQLVKWQNDWGWGKMMVSEVC